MKKIIIRKSFKKSLAIVLGSVLLATGIYVIPKNAKNVDARGEATDLKSGISCVQEFTFDEFKTYRGTTNTAPAAPDEGNYKGWLFAGWFTDETCTTAADTVTEGPVYAKFVSPDVLIVACQVSTKTNAQTTDGSEDARLRLVSTVDSADYEKVGFTVTGSNKKPKTYWEDTVYEKIITVDADVKYDAEPNIFNTQSEYFFTHKFTKLKVDTPYTVTPCWTTLDGTVVNGVTRYVRLSDSWNQYINVPVRLYTGEAVGAGYMEITVPDNYTFAGVDKIDAGTIFEKMTVSQSGNVIKCAGILENVSKDKAADGMYLNLKFTTTDTKNTSKLDTFTIRNIDFCNVSEDSVENVEAQAVCLNFNQ